MDSIRPDPDKVSAIKNYQVPHNMKQMQRFLGLVQWCKQFIPELAKISGPLYKLLSKNTDFVIGQREIEAVQAIKDKISSAPFLRYPIYDNPDGHGLIQTDASATAVGSVLMHQQGDERWVISYNSRILNKAEFNYSTVERECLALVYAFKQYRHYIFGRKVFVESDHKPLSWLQTAQSKNNRLQKWSIFLSEFDYEVTWIKGRDNGCADFLSRKDEIEATPKISPTPPISSDLPLSLPKLSNKPISPMPRTRRTSLSPKRATRSKSVDLDALLSLLDSLPPSHLQ